MKIKIPSLFSKKKINFEPEKIDWNDDTICILCRKANCICDIKKCFCNKKANQCLWPSKICPCPICFENLLQCKCTTNIKEEE